MKKKILVILIIGTILGLGGAILKNSPFSKDKRMLEQVSSIVSELKNNENTVSDSVYRLEDIEKMGIYIPISPYGTAYSKSSYITNFNNTYYASFDNGKQKISGNIDELKFSEISFLNRASSFSANEEETKILLAKYLKEKYNEEFEIVSITSDINFLWEFKGYICTAKAKTGIYTEPFICSVSPNVTNVLDSYYDFIIDDEYKNLILNAVGKVDSNFKIIGFSNDSEFPYGDNVRYDLSLEEALKNKFVNRDTSLLTYKNLSEKQIKEIEQSLKDINYRGNLSIYIVNKKIYNEVDKLSIEEQDGEYVTKHINPKLKDIEPIKLDFYN